ncbi:MAG: hypothetical protein KDD51_02575 [Bdellovibrionales bacterium]|nr:hypothetical protein [Bdellovibrionales bacterium]
MTKTLFILSLLLGTLAYAEPGTYVGEGVWGTPGKQDMKYSAKIVITELEKGVVQMEETWNIKSEDKSSGQEAKEGETYVTTYEFAENGTYNVKKNGEFVGSGYCRKDADSKWCDHKLATEKGPMHISVFYSPAEKTLYRIGDLVNFEGGSTFRDQLKKQD